MVRMSRQWRISDPGIPQAENRGGVVTRKCAAPKAPRVEQALRNGNRQRRQPDTEFFRHAIDAARKLGGHEDQQKGVRMSITFYESNNARQERAAEQQIAARAQAYRNAFEWKRRSLVAKREGNLHLALRLHRQAIREIRKYN